MIDLHLHLDGSLRPSTVREILMKKNLKQFGSEEEAKEALGVSGDCKDLNEYLEKFEYPTQILQDQESMERAVMELGSDIFSQGVTYAEIRFAPLLATRNGMTEDEAVEAAVRGAIAAEKKCQGLQLGLILCCMRGDFHARNILTVEAARKYLGDHVCALDLAGAEALYPAELYADEFRLAKKYDVPYTIHAGEAAGPESIWRALEMGAKRIGHGIRAIEDSTLVDYLARYEIPIEVCPISNMHTKVFKDVEQYPLKELLLNGVHATLNTDNMTVSNTNLAREREFIINNCDITQEDIELMEEYSRKAAFLL